MYMYSILILLLLCCWKTECLQLVRVRQVQEETGSVNGNTRSKRQIVPRLPDHLEFSLQSETELSTILKLSRLPEIPTYVFTKSGLEKHYGELENRAVYSVEDDKIGVIHVRRTNNSKSESADNFQLEGEFVVENKIYQIEPVGEDSERLYRTDDGPRDLYHKLFNRQADYRQPKKEEGRYRRAVREYTVELCYIIDAEDFQKRFLPRNNNNEDRAVSGAQIFYSYVSEQIRLRYASTYEVNLSFMFKFVITGLVILKERSDSEFLEDLVKKNGNSRGTIEYNDGLDAATGWLYLNEKSLPPSDHYMFFTSYDLADGDDTDSLGLANLGSMCLRDEDDYPLSVSIIENGFDANVGATGAHELGHCLNADHDTDAGCEDGDLYLMSERSLHPKSPEKASNPWKFSNCSVRDMLLYLETEDVSCLSDQGSTTDSLRERQIKDGVHYTLTDQCSMAFVAGSRFCQGKYQNPASNATFCYKVYCTDSNGKCEPIFPRDFTKCGNDHWCFKGECIKAREEDYQMELEGDDTEIAIVQDTYEVLPRVKYTKSSTSDVIVFNNQWNPEFADTFFHFNKSNGRITVKTGALFNITEVEVFITATTNDTYTTFPISIMIYIYNESYTPKFAQTRFVIEVTNSQIKSAEKTLVVMSDFSQVLSEGDQNRDLTFQIQDSQHSNLVRLVEKQLILDADKLRQAELSNFTVTIDAIFKNILRNSTTIEIIVEQTADDNVRGENNNWMIPVIIVSIFAIGGFIIFVIIQIRQCRNPSSSNCDKSSSPLPKLNPTTDAKDGGNLSPVFTPL